MKNEPIIVDISSRKVSIFENQYIPVQRKQGKKITGTGVTKQVKIASFKRDEVSIPAEIQESLTDRQIQFLKTELINAYEADIAPTINKEFHERITRLHDNLLLIHLLEIESDDIKVVSEILSKMKKQKKKQTE